VFLEPGCDPLLVSDTHRHQFLRAVHHVRHTPFRHADPACLEGLMPVRHTAVLPKAPPTTHGNHLQATFAMRECPAPFFFGSEGVMVIRAVWLETVVDHQGHVPLAGERHHVAVAVRGHPQRLPTSVSGVKVTSCVAIGRSRSSSHLLLLLGLSACFSFQRPPVFKPSVPFSGFF